MINLINMIVYVFSEIKVLKDVCGSCKNGVNIFCL